MNIVSKHFQAYDPTDFFPKSIRDLLLAVESQNHSTVEEFELKRTFEAYLISSPGNEQGDLQLNQVI